MTIRTHEAGDFDWVLLRHRDFYRQEYGFDHRFEALVSRLLADFAEGHDPRRETLWIAEDGGRRVGSIMLTRDGVDDSEATGRLRLFFVEPGARGHGVGSRLIGTLLTAARDRGYRTIVLSTVDRLAGARRLYERAGFTIDARHQHEDWSVSVTEEVWRLEL